MKLKKHLQRKLNFCFRKQNPYLSRSWLFELSSTEFWKTELSLLPVLPSSHWKGSALPPLPFSPTTLMGFGLSIFSYWKIYELFSFFNQRSNIPPTWSSPPPPPLLPETRPPSNPPPRRPPCSTTLLQLVRWEHDLFGQFVYVLTFSHETLREENYFRHGLCRN